MPCAPWPPLSRQNPTSCFLARSHNYIPFGVFYPNSLKDHFNKKDPILHLVRFFLWLWRIAWCVFALRFYDATCIINCMFFHFLSSWCRNGQKPAYWYHKFQNGLAPGFYSSWKTIESPGRIFLLQCIPVDDTQCKVHCEFQFNFF